MPAIERLRRIHNPNSLPYVCEMYLPEKQRFNSAGQRPPGNLLIMRLFGNAKMSVMPEAPKKTGWKRLAAYAGDGLAVQVPGQGSGTFGWCCNSPIIRAAQSGIGVAGRNVSQRGLNQAMEGIYACTLAASRTRESFRLQINRLGPNITLPFKFFTTAIYSPGSSDL